MKRVRMFAVVISAVALVAACSSGPSSPLSPAMVPSQSAAAGAGGGPSSYNADGPWFGLVFFGEQRVGEGVHIFTQAPSGSLTAVGSEAPDDPERDHGIYTFKRVGSPNGTVRNFRFSLSMPAQSEESCGRELTGDAQLNTETNTIVATGTGVIDNCATVTVTFKWTKL